MKNLRLFAFATCSFTLSAACLVVACGDDTIVSVDAGGGFDGSTDAPSSNDGEALEDGAVRPDAKPDAPPGLVDAGLTLEGYKNTVANTLCSTLANCCYGTKGGVPDSGAVDGGTFNTNRCLDIYKRLGFEQSNLGGSLAVNGGNVELDQAKALDCLDRLNKLSCSLSGTELAQARTSCFEALRGKLTAGQTCKDSIECAAGLFCNPKQADGGGNGTCTALKAQGEGCSIWDTGSDDSDQQTNEQACSWRSSGTPPLHCDSYDFQNQVYRARADWKCAPAVNIGDGCNSTPWCNASICDPDDYTCKTPVQYFTTFVCNDLVTP